MKRILIVDDEPRWVSFAMNDLDGFELTIAAGVDDAIDKLEADRFDLVIASARYIEVVRTIAERFQNKRVVVATAQPTTQEALHAFRLGARNYWPKTFQPRSLYDQVESLDANAPAAA